MPTRPHSFHLLTRLIITPVIILLLVSIFQPTHASDQNVTCDPNGCSGITGPLLSITNMVPLQTISSLLSITNNHPTPQNIAIKLHPTSFPGILSDKLIFTIRDLASTPLYGPLPLTQAYESTFIPLSIIESQTQTTYHFSLYLQNVDNSYQNLKTSFDLNFGLTAQPSDTATSFSSTIGGPSSYSAPVCTAPPPATAPNLTASPTAPNSAFLSWSSVEPVTHYMIRYGTSPNDFIYGAANVDNINSYLVQSLSAGSIYSFQVAGVNDCMPGPWSNTASITPTGDIFAPGPAPGFNSQILGLTDNLSLATPSAQASTSALTTGQVAGDTCTDPAVSWWLPIALQLIFTLYHYLRLRYPHPRPPTWWLPPLLIGLISLIIHLLRGCNCATHPLCPYSPLLNLSILILTTTAYLSLSPPPPLQTSSKKK